MSAPFKPGGTDLWMVSGLLSGGTKCIHSHAAFVFFAGMRLVYMSLQSFIKVQNKEQGCLIHVAVSHGILTFDSLKSHIFIAGTVPYILLHISLCLTYYVIFTLHISLAWGTTPARPQSVGAPDLSIA